MMIPRMRGAGVQSEDSDKAFWISFADLMTALMVLFMMVMAVALLSITRAVSSGKSSQDRVGYPSRQAASAPGASASDAMSSGAAQAAASASAAAQSASVASAAANASQAEATQVLLEQLARVVSGAPGVQLDSQRYVIDFGDRARFETGSHRLDKESARLLREFTPSLLSVVGSDLGKRWVRRVIVEGFADPRGTYFYNLNLSLQRGERVICTLLDAGAGQGGLDADQRAKVRDIFAVGGFSFNDPRDSLGASRRIEMRIEFGPAPGTAATPASSALGDCALPS